MSLHNKKERQEKLESLKLHFVTKYSEQLFEIDKISEVLLKIVSKVKSIDQINNHLKNIKITLEKKSFNSTKSKEEALSIVENFNEYEKLFFTIPQFSGSMDKSKTINKNIENIKEGILSGNIQSSIEFHKYIMFFIDEEGDCDNYCKPKLNIKIESSKEASYGYSLSKKDIKTEKCYNIYDYCQENQSNKELIERIAICLVRAIDELK